MKTILRITCLPMVVLATVIYSAIVGLPHPLTDWFWRPQFVQACVFAAGGDLSDRVLDFCNDAYYRRQAVADRGWRASAP